MSIWYDIKSILHLVIAFQCGIFISYLAIQKHAKQWRNTIFSLFLAAIAIPELGRFAFYFEPLRAGMYNQAPQLFYAYCPFIYLSAPVLYLYIRSYVQKNVKLTKKDILHLAPFVMVSLFIVVKIAVLGSSGLKQTLSRERMFSANESLWLTGLDYFQFILYITAALILLSRYRQSIKQIFSNITRIKLSWLRLTLYGFICWKVCLTVYYIGWTTSGRTVFLVTYVVSEILLLLFLYVLFLKALGQPVIFGDPLVPNSRNKYEKILLSSAQKKEYRKRLIAFMQQYKPYLRSDLNLHELSEMVHIPAHHLSQLLNMDLHQNFYDFINSYRIEECIRLLQQQDLKKKTILEILYETGFNSKSVFNKAFKKVTGMTPTEFRNRKTSFHRSAEADPS